MPTGMLIKDRIKELRRVPATSLLRNPKNWWTHSDNQANALRGVLAEVGFADAVLAGETPDSLMLIDGHLRAETTGEGIIPVLVLDVNEAESDLILATLDPLAGLADTNGEALNELLSTLEVQSEAVKVILEDLAEQVGLTVPVIPFSRISELGATMYRGEKTCDRSDTGDTPGHQPEEGGSTPTLTL